MADETGNIVESKSHLSVKVIYLLFYRLWQRQQWQPTPVFLPGESPWTEEPGGAAKSQT